MSTLSEELRQPLYAALSDADAAAALNAVDKTETYSRFGSFRTMASLLTPDEYNALRPVLDTAAQASAVVSDMLGMLKLPGDEQGNGGGIDFGNAAVQAMLDQLCTAEVAGKLKGYAERLTSTTALLGLGHVGEGDVTRIRAETAAGG